jgi:hypothetical protein
VTTQEFFACRTALHAVREAKNFEAARRGGSKGVPAGCQQVAGGSVGLVGIDETEAMVVALRADALVAPAAGYVVGQHPAGHHPRRVLGLATSRSHRESSAASAARSRLPATLHEGAPIADRMDSTRSRSPAEPVNTIRHPPAPDRRRDSAANRSAGQRRDGAEAPGCTATTGPGPRSASSAATRREAVSGMRSRRRSSSTAQPSEATSSSCRRTSWRRRAPGSRSGSQSVRSW